MKRFAIVIFLFICSLTGFSTTWTITNVSFTFSPSAVTIVSGDEVNFVLESFHTAVEVSQATWNANGNTPLPGGFSTGFGGGLVLAAQLTAGTHYYVCSPHASGGMKGVIIVNATTGIADNRIKPNVTLYPNPTSEVVNVIVGNSLLGSEYYLTDEAGKQILNGKITSELFSLDLSQFKGGVYLLLIKDQAVRAFRVTKN
jgi:plastocyanin